MDPLINISKSEFLAFGSEDGLCNHGCIRMGRSSTTTLGSVPSVDPIRRRRCLLLLLIILLRHMGRRTDDALTPNWRLEWRRQQVVLLRFPAWRQKVLVHDLARGLNTLHQIIWMHHFFCCREGNGANSSIHAVVFLYATNGLFRYGNFRVSRK